VNRKIALKRGKAWLIGLKDSSSWGERGGLTIDCMGARQLGGSVTKVIKQTSEKKGTFSAQIKGLKEVHAEVKGEWCWGHWRLRGRIHYLAIIRELKGV